MKEEREYFWAERLWEYAKDNPKFELCLRTYGGQSDKGKTEYFLVDLNYFLRSKGFIVEKIVISNNVAEYPLTGIDVYYLMATVYFYKVVDGDVKKYYMTLSPRKTGTIKEWYKLMMDVEVEDVVVKFSVARGKNPTTYSPNWVAAYTDSEMIVLAGKSINWHKLRMDEKAMDEPYTDNRCNEGFTDEELDSLLYDAYDGDLEAYRTR